MPGVQKSIQYNLGAPAAYVCVWAQVLPKLFYKRVDSSCKVSKESYVLQVPTSDQSSRSKLQTHSGAAGGCLKDEGISY
jgi:hypothetical protein